MHVQGCARCDFLQEKLLCEGFNHEIHHVTTLFFFSLLKTIIALAPCVDPLSDGLLSMPFCYNGMLHTVEGHA